MLYAIKTVRGNWWTLRNKREAIKDAKCIGDAEVYSHPDVPELSAWDWPTFCIGATRIYPVQ